MLRELSLLAKRRQGRMSNALPPPPDSSANSGPSDASTGAAADGNDSSPLKHMSRGLSSLPRRLSRGPVPFSRGNSFLNRHRSSAASSTGSTAVPTAASNTAVDKKNSSGSASKLRVYRHNIHIREPKASSDVPESVNAINDTDNSSTSEKSVSGSAMQSATTTETARTFTKDSPTHKALAAAGASDISVASELSSISKSSVPSKPILPSRSSSYARSHAISRPPTSPQMPVKSVSSIASKASPLLSQTTASSQTTTTNRASIANKATELSKRLDALKSGVSGTVDVTNRTSVVTDTVDNKAAPGKTSGTAAEISCPVTSEPGVARAPITPRSFIGKSGISAPLTCVDDLMKWRPTGAAARCVSTVPLSEAAVRRYIRGGVDRLQTSGNLPPVAASRAGASSLKRLQPPRLLLCHDFKAGYPPWEARAAGVAGEECPPDSEMWRFNHWAYVDVFVYFSHSRVTIPPVGYIHAAHRHGSLTLGTLIFENDDGAEDLGKILMNFKSRAKAASQLASIAKFYGFDGWLVNVEVALQAGSSAASDLAAFVGDLTRSTRKTLGSVSEVIWYDAVARDGSLSWQNELNENNEQFFKAAGAIYTNYHWDRNAPVRSAVKAGTRRTDVFTGVDIYGRNTFGGGGFHTHIALRAIKQGGTSAALFAPAWTVDKCPPNVPDPRQLEERFWTGPSGRFGRECVAQYFKERPVVTDLPFSTCFDPGWGPRSIRNGNIKDDRRYFNIAQQQVQPSFMRTVVAAGDAAASELSLSQEFAYNGSTSIKLLFAFSDSRMLSGSFSVLRLFVANVAFPPRLSPRANNSQEGSLKVTYTYFAQCESGPELASNDFGLLLLFGSPSGVVLLVGQNSRWNTSRAARRGMPRLQIHGRYVDMEVIVADSDRRAFGAPTEKNPGASGWMTRTFTIDASILTAQRLVEIMVIVGGPQEQLTSMRPSPVLSPTASIRGSRVGSRTASRVTSRIGSRVGSRSVSRSGSPPRGGDSRRHDESSDLRRTQYEHMNIPEGEDLRVDTVPESGRQSDVFGSNLLNRYRDSVSHRRQPAQSHGNIDHIGGIMSPGRSRDSGISHRLPHSLAYGDMVAEGNLNFDSIEMDEDISTNASQSMGRYGSRFATSFGGSRYGSRLGSLAASRAGSVNPSALHSLSSSRNVSVANSRFTSRAGSQFVSPSLTPLTGGGGARPLESRDGMRSGVLSPGFVSRRTSGLDSGIATPRSSATIGELKSVLMQAAGTMAGTEVPMDGNNGRGGMVRIVYLGGLTLDLIGGEDNERAGNTKLPPGLIAGRGYAS